MDYDGWTALAVATLELAIAILELLRLMGR